MTEFSRCSVCLNLWQDYWDLGPFREHYFEMDQDHCVDVAEINRAIEQGCPSCRVIGKIVEPYMPQLVGQKNELWLRFSSIASNPHPRTNKPYRYLCFRGQDESPENVIAELEVKRAGLGSGLFSVTSERSYCPWDEIQPAPSVSGDTGSRKAAARARSWLHQCMEEHHSCRTPSNTYTPTRLLRIEGPDKARLCVPNKPVEAYACLSHCWGKLHILRTTTENYEQHLKEISWGQLPLTFRHAIAFTHSIGLRYLWIDSLCILQDSASDWRHEASKMPDIYENACVTLAATMSYDPSQGLFARSQEGFISKTYTIHNEQNEPYEIYCREPLEDIVWDKPLQDRGWAFQERILSKRIIHFMEEELWWECHQGSTCECGSRDHGPKIDFGTMPRVKELQNCSSAMEIELHWQRIVKEYSSRSLTFPSDIFPALQGLAKLVPASMGTYLAGHWESTLIHSLCWSLEQADSRLLIDTERRKHWRAPTWSWASAILAMEWGEGLPVHTFASAVSARIVPQGVEPTGQLVYGEVVLRGRCLRGRIAHGKTQDPWWAASALLNNGPVEAQASQVPRIYLFDDDVSNVSDQLDEDEDHWWAYPHWDFHIEAELGREVIAMKMETTDQGAQQSWLILKATDVEGVYERLGLMRVDEDLDEWGATFFQPVEDLDDLFDSSAKTMQVTVI
ncbi:HET-domain-containing protein [Aaosphaeria arxii CBS 175.79]|uniref:HET-domain-containing protein n=1 Tax=Aaosphaeria arxii CBS 175.79 TaxID=1450172 RepID=A0A6A5XNC8_9PLEO|nr:HET-domain-containing protein [Aaosphaeria arxii CBS 175.79]KAF2014357.1 HET-domain-containing protein [Aaosphaeria arxii CBS 175.79]